MNARTDTPAGAGAARRAEAADRHGLSQPEPVGRSEPPAGPARARARGARRRDRDVLRVDHRRLAVFELHGGAGRERPARRPQPRVLRGAQPAAAHVGAGVAQRSGGVPQLSRSFSSRTSSRISGGDRRSAGATTTSSGSARASRSTSPRSTRSTSAATRCSPPCCGSCAGGAWMRSDQGPVYLGYRLGHIRGESRVFRALVYNKSAAVLHMLRRLVGDEAFFRGLRRFYRESRFRKVGHRGFPRGDGSGNRPLARAVLRALDLRLDAAEAEVQLTASRAPRSCCTSNRSARSSTCRSR